VKAGVRQSNRLAGISDYTGNRREIEKWNSFFDPEDGGNMFFRNVG
jgi:hypothetical protein